MKFEYICYDYVDIPTKCNFCTKTLNSWKGIYCKDLVNNKFFFSGPSCATKNSSKFKNSRKNIPDYTTECFISENDEEMTEVTSSTKETKNGISGQNNFIGSSNDSSDILKKAKEYIIFFYSRLADFKGVTYYAVDNIYRDLKTNETLSAKSEQHLINWYKSKNTNLKI
ncbi:hypothetical protein ACWNT8_14740 [Pigmentibacter ruber]